MPDGRRLAVANGGIETDPTSGRAELNLATMQSNLAYVDVGDGGAARRAGAAGGAAAALAPPHRRRAGRDAGGGAAVAGLGAGASAAPGGASAGARRGWRLLAARAGGAAADAELCRQRGGQRRRAAGGVHRAAGEHDAGLRPGERRARWRWSSRPTSAGWRRVAAGFACSTGEGLFLRHGGGAGADAQGLAFDNHLVRIEELTSSADFGWLRQGAKDAGGCQWFTGICSTYNPCTSHAQRMH